MMLSSSTIQFFTLEKNTPADSPWPGMDFGVEQVAHQEYPALRDVEGDIARGMCAAFLGDLEGEPA